MLDSHHKLPSLDDAKLLSDWVDAQRNVLKFVQVCCAFCRFVTGFLRLSQISRQELAAVIPKDAEMQSAKQPMLQYHMAVSNKTNRK